MGIDSMVISDTFDYLKTKTKLDNFNKNFRKDFNIKNDDIVFLQATRIVPRKRIEIAINLVKKLKNNKIILVMAGHAGDEGYLYYNKLVKLAEKSNIRYIFAGDYIGLTRKIDVDGRRVYTLWDAFINEDFMTYLSEIEGCGIQYIESACFKKSVIITTYHVYESDIKPL